MTINKKVCKHIIQPIVKCRLTKVGISRTLYTVVRYGPRSLGGTGIFDPFVIQVTGRIYFLVEFFWKSTPFSPLLWYNLYNQQLEAGRGGRILENNYIEATKWLQT